MPRPGTRSYGLDFFSEQNGGHMPKKIHDKLAKEAAAKGLKGDRKNAYIYGTLREIEKK